MSKELDLTPAERNALAVARQKQDLSVSTVFPPQRGKRLPTAMPAWGRWHGNSRAPFDPNLGNKVLSEALGNFFGNRRHD